MADERAVKARDTMILGGLLQRLARIQVHERSRYRDERNAQLTPSSRPLRPHLSRPPIAGTI